MGWWRRKGVSEEAKKILRETIEKAEEEAFKQCIKHTVAGLVVGMPLEQIKKNMLQALYHGAIDGGADEEEALKDAQEKWEKILAQAKDHLKTKGVDVK